MVPMSRIREPRYITAVYDNGGKTFDRYTVTTSISEGHGMKMCLGLSSNPTNPQGFSQFTTCQVGSHLGKKIPWAKLPANIRRHIIARFREDT